MDTIGGGEVSLGDLADLTVTNDNDLSCDLSDSKDAFKKTWNPKFTLRSHYDGIRSWLSTTASQLCLPPPRTARSSSGTCRRRSRPRRMLR